MNCGKLALVATPIGNLGDITLRALEALRQADVIAAEDTRRTVKLLNHYGIKNKLVSFHEYSKEARFEEIIGFLTGGKNVALVSDAGTPVISDPGYELVRRCIAKGIEVESIPGACAAITAVTLSGMDCSRFMFWGFLNQKQAARRRELEEIREKGVPCVVYESPNRILKLLADMCDVCGEDTPVCVCRELTKLHEESLRMTAKEAWAALGRREAIKGEFAVVFYPPAASGESLSEEQIAREVEQRIKNGMTKKSAAAAVAAEYGLPKNKVYGIALESGKRG
ncbi:16S rRNA (cytidine(1402)-2'-O)-methyltransferase [Christensenella intestinihominis]|uniref:16S rRNA (cytidine(1402)-2'-O)-methyltransferase n=1 Tax=Christensenella intestinihominis TaxID=1851429 RepID=UPI000AE6E8E3|nr:16S rRNA (cytidine(1402)-2'-O)-methyltransferase [Christensenella intestinihominis]